jgi:hypothetical protein
MHASSDSSDSTDSTDLVLQIQIAPVIRRDTTLRRSKTLSILYSTMNPQLTPSSTLRHQRGSGSHGSRGPRDYRLHHSEYEMRPVTHEWTSYRTIEYVQFLF